jgi:hypothetical protein
MLIVEERRCAPACSHCLMVKLGCITIVCQTKSDVAVNVVMVA